MDWTQPSVIISIIALLVSVISLGWNVLMKIIENKSRLDFTATVNRYTDNKITNSCTVSVTNVGQKPVTIRQIVIHQKKNKKVLPFHTNYRDYSKDIENKPLTSGEWRHIVLYEHKDHPFYDINTSDYKFLRVTIIDSKRKKYKSKWFQQNNYH